MKVSREPVPVVKSVASREGKLARGASPSPLRVPTVQVIRRIRASGPRVLLTVLAQHVHEVARAQRGNDAHLCPTLGRGVRPRLCHVVKDEGGFGFSITQGELGAREGSGWGISALLWAEAGRSLLFVLPGHRGPFWLVLSTGGAAEQAGVPPGARLLEVNGVSVEKFTHNQLSKKV